MIKKIFGVLFLTVAIAVAAYFGYSKYSEYKLIQSLTPHVKNTSLRLANALSYETENTNITYKEFFEKIENDIAEIERRLLEVQTISTPINKATTDVVIDYVKTGQALLRSQIGLNRKRFAVSISDEAESIKLATSETKEARTAFGVSLKKMAESRVQLSALMPADCVLDASLLRQAIKKIDSEVALEEKEAIVASRKKESEAEEEILVLQQKVTINPENVNAWTRLGNLYFDSEQFEQSIAAYNKSLALKPDDADVRTDLGVMYRRNGQPDLALAAFNEALEIDPKHTAARFNKGVALYYDLQDPEGGIRAWEELVAIHPDALAPNGMTVTELIEEVQKDSDK